MFKDFNVSVPSRGLGSFLHFTFGNTYIDFASFPAPLEDWVVSYKTIRSVSRALRVGFRPLSRIG